MDTQSPASRTPQAKTSRTERGEKEDRGKNHSTHRSARYKEKYQVMRERFERVNAVKEAYQHDLELAYAKIRKIQEENDLLLDAMLANPPSSLIPSAVPHSKHYQSPIAPHPAAPSQGYMPNQTQYQSVPPPPPHPVYQYPPRPEHHDPAHPPPPPPHGYHYSHPPPPRQYQYPPYAANDGREGGAGPGHHYPRSIESSRSRGPPPDHDLQTDSAYTLRPAYPRVT